MPFACAAGVMGDRARRGCFAITRRGRAATSFGSVPTNCHDETGVEEESLFPYTEIAANCFGRGRSGLADFGEAPFEERALNRVRRQLERTAV
jgi:hypothetical protein